MSIRVEIIVPADVSVRPIVCDVAALPHIGEKVEFPHNQTWWRVYDVIHLPNDVRLNARVFLEAIS
jgi:hypothetical protein